ncbi:hypothetical protein RJ639_002301 [Escallonia herrerae]|uniref:Retrovirus-related Pol polyprotein from transposon RE1 n=1 Tax=Escallonia herrerae TaxID=1293975 RepID=A0AA88XFW7_9ASTE|nr:hypothetical protein RJ639_002301 [Escallonia herrerae]
MATESSSFSRTSSGQESINTGGSEGSDILITKHKLTGHNYHQWAKSVMMFISGKGKDDYLTGTASPPQKDDPSFRMWKTENNMVMSWLINTMDTEIGHNFLFYDTAYEIWMAAKETYSDNDNTAELFDIKRTLHDLRQEEMSVTQYYNTLSRFWQQLDGFESLDWECPADASQYKKIIEKERVFKFLLGLDKSLDEVRGRILGAKPLPTIRDAFSEVRREESRKKLMMGTRPSSSILEGSALVSRGSSPSIPEGSGFVSRGPTSTNDARQRKGRPWCDHCRRPSHTKEICWKIHGKPANWKPNREKEAQGFMVDSEGTGKTISDPVSFSKEQVEWLQKMFSSGSSLAPVISAGSTAQKGNFLTALYSKAEDSSYWIIDSGASDYMTGDVSLLHECSSCHENYKVRIADGSLSTVTGIGKVIISERLILNSVLLVPNLSCNLLSISKITQDLNCVVNFSSTHCLFQDLDSGKMIGNAKESKGLYRIRTDDQQDTRAHHGENSISQEEYQFWDIPTLDIHLRLSESHSQPDIEPSHFDTQPSDPNLTQGGNKELKDKELKVYSRRQKNPKPMEPYMHPEPCQTDVPSSTPTEVIQGNDEEEISKLKQVLSREFEIKDLGTLRYFLGMEPADTPMDPFNKVGLKKDSATVDKGRYQRLVGKLIYLSHTRPDISFAVSTVSQFMNNPTKEHQEAVFRILRYLKMTPGRGLFFKKGVSRSVEIFSDADWAGSLSDRRSTSGYCTYIWGNLVTWRSKKQSVVARSSAEAEFRAMAHGICEGMWLKRLLEELQFSPSASMKMMCDNKAAISIAKNPVHHDRTKHIEIDRHFIKEKIEQGVIEVDYTPTRQQTADVLTKAIPRGPFDIHLSKLGLIDIHSSA